MDAERTVAELDVLIGADGTIAELVPPGTGLAAGREIDATGRVIVPGLVQAHTHLCQTLFRGLAEDRSLLTWLRERVWPLEAALDAPALRAAAELAIAELLLGGTTAVLDMGSVHHTDVLFEVADQTGIRYTGGKAMMDTGEGVPSGLLETTAQSLREADDLARRWHGAAGGRLRYAYAPRFVLTSTWDLLRSIATRIRASDMLVHTHASEQREEVEAVRRRFRVPNVQLLASIGLAGSNACLAHCVWVEPSELDVLEQSGATVVHCPSSNLKLASGIAPIAAYLERGVNVALGADGAACNNRLDVWEELRLAALLAKEHSGPESVSAVEAFELATLGGARALGLESEIGSIEVGKRADVVILDLRAPHATGPEDVYTQLVYSARADDVRTVVVDGQVVVEERALCTLDVGAVMDEAEVQRTRLVRRAGVELAYPALRA